MKRMLTVALAAMLGVGLAGCADEEEIEPGVDGVESPVTEPGGFEPAEPGEPAAGENGELPKAVEEEPASELPKQGEQQKKQQ